MLRPLDALRSIVLRPFVGEPSPPVPPNPMPLRDGVQPAVPLPEGLPESAYDGAILGGDGRAYPPNTPLEAVPAYRPRSGPVREGSLVWLNGVYTPLAMSQGDLQRMADTTGLPTKGVHVATRGFIPDVWQTLLDRFDAGNNPAKDVVARLMHEAVQDDRPLLVGGYSHGAGSVSRAAINTQKDPVLHAEFADEEVKGRMARNIRALTLAGSASAYPDFIRWTHVVNRTDITQLFSGFMLGDNPPNPLVHQGKGSRNFFFVTPNPFTAHDIAYYLAALRQQDEGEPI